jgi:hypothetical protein
MIEDSIAALSFQVWCFMNWANFIQNNDLGVCGLPGHGRPQDEELTRLRKEVKSLREANEILKEVLLLDFSTGHLNYYI